MKKKKRTNVNIRGKTKKIILENEYNKYFTVPLSIIQQSYETLEQPSPLKIVPSISTSGAFDEPVKTYRESIRHA